MKKNKFLYGIIIFIFINIEVAQACCDEMDYFKVTKVSKYDILNVRKEPHPLAPIIAKLQYKDRYFMLEGYPNPKEEMHEHTLCVDVSFRSYKGKTSVNKWCKLRQPKGWVNMFYLKGCKVETGDIGNIIKSECKDIILGQNISKYMFYDIK